jgi:hypothetical protein
MPDVITLVNMGLLRRIKWEPERTAYKPFELPIKRKFFLSSGGYWAGQPL